MLIESKDFPGYYEIPESTCALINRAGSVINKTSGWPYPTWVDGATGRQMVVYPLKRHANRKVYVSRILAEIFLDPPHNRRSRKDIVGFRDGNPTNGELDNLFWTTTGEQQRLFWNRIHQEYRKALDIPLRQGDDDGIFPNLREATVKPGFYFIPPHFSHVVVNRQGELFNLITGEVHCTSTNKRGYIKASLQVDEHTYRSVSVHRIVAMVFVPKPPKYANTPYEELHVNHKDGVKNNNHADNLEWVSSAENMEHAVITGLFHNRAKVLSFHPKSGDALFYPSIAECARAHHVTHAMVATHLYSKAAGRIAFNEWVYKLDDGSEWPTVLFHVNGKFRPGTVYDFVVIDKVTKTLELFSSIQLAAKSIGVQPWWIKNRRARTGGPFEVGRYRILTLGEYLQELEINEGDRRDDIVRT